MAVPKWFIGCAIGGLMGWHAYDGAWAFVVLLAVVWLVAVRQPDDVEAAD